ncbi:hypothetical protein [Nocardia takedensis]|uniref:hypothetical protein n=2 Tax=Nocardia takedensis TaxID=259390 RepID=UPI0005926E4E|nr:hypothetical protein [Nocardia takedensis]
MVDSTDPHQARCQECGTDMVPWTECYWLEVDPEQLWRYRYELAVLLLSDDEDGETSMSELHSRAIARAWGNADYPGLARWGAGTQDRDYATLKVEATRLAESLDLSRDTWKYEGFPGPQIDAAFALARYFTARAAPTA